MPGEVVYDVKEVLARIEGKLDTLSAHLGAEVSLVRERVAAVEQRLELQGEANRVRAATYDALVADVGRLKEASVSEEAVQDYRNSLAVQRRWLIGLAVTVAGLLVSVLALVLARIATF